MTTNNTDRASATETSGDSSSEPPEQPDPSPTMPPEPRTTPGPGAEQLCIEIIDPALALTGRERESLRAHAANASLEAGATGGEVRIKLVNDERMSIAHEEHCGVAGTTDVITFNLAQDEETTLDCDLLVCVDEARRQAEQRGHDVVRELALYVLHGVLHCLGEDDKDEDSYERIHTREDEILRAVGLGTTFGPDDETSGGGLS